MPAARDWAALALLAVLALGCAGPSTPATVGPPATPLTQVTPAIDAARAALAAQLKGDGFTLSQSSGYEPGQPASLQAVPRAVYELNLADPNQGWLVIYDVGTSDGALAAGGDFANYLHTFGHSNYPSDAQFTLNAINSALVFYWWAASRSSEPERAAKAFELIASVGERIDVSY
jgi:hypothetical protein